MDPAEKMYSRCHTLASSQVFQYRLIIFFIIARNYQINVMHLFPGAY